MRINEKKFPQLKEIYEAHSGQTQPMYVSMTFFEAAKEEQDKFSEGETLGDALNDPISKELTGETFIFLDKAGSIMHGIWGISIEWVVEQKTIVQVIWDYDDPQEVKIKARVDKKVSESGMGSGYFNGPYFTAMIKMFLAFKKYSETKYKELAPKGKLIDDDEIKTRYKSDFDFKIGLLTENWFTESSQGDPFLVRPHLHKYYFGPGKSQVRFNWIKAYWKRGYTKGAYKNKQ